MLSSKVNQWTLLDSTIPVVFAISAGTFSGLPIDGHQRIELLLTAAQSLFAVSILLDRVITGAAAGVLFGLFGLRFAASLLLSAEADRWVALGLSAVYIILALIRLVLRFRDTGRTYTQPHSHR